MKKDFRYTVTPKGHPDKILLQQIVTFGSEEQPFPEDWEEQPIIGLRIVEKVREIFDREFDVDIQQTSEHDSLDKFMMMWKKEELEALKQEIPKRGRTFGDTQLDARAVAHGINYIIDYLIASGKLPFDFTIRD